MVIVNTIASAAAPKYCTLSHRLPGEMENSPSIRLRKKIVGMDTNAVHGSLIQRVRPAPPTPSTTSPLTVSAAVFPSLSLPMPTDAVANTDTSFTSISGTPPRSEEHTSELQSQ